MNAVAVNREMNNTEYLTQCLVRTESAGVGVVR